MELKSFTATDGSGNVVPLPTAYLYQTGTTTLVAGLQKADGSALTNPFTGTQDGQLTFAAPDGSYDLRISGAGRDKVVPIRFADASLYGAAVAARDQALGGAVTATTKAAEATTARDQTIALFSGAALQPNPATPTVPPTGVVSGAYYWAAVTDGEQLYVNTSGTGAPYTAPSSGATLIRPLKSAVDNASAYANTALDKTTSTSKNLFDRSRTVSGYVNSTGGITAGSFVTSDFIPVIPGASYVSSASISSTASAFVAFYDASGALVSTSQNGTSGYPAGTPIVVPSTPTIRTMRVTFSNSAALAAVAVAQGTSLPAKYRSFGGLDAYTAHKDRLALLSALATRNAVVVADVQDGFTLNTSNDVLTAVGGFYVTGYVPVSDELPFVLGQGNTYTAANGIAWYDINKVRIGTVAAPLAANSLYAPPFGAAYARWTGRKSDTTIADFAAYYASAVPTVLPNGALMDRGASFTASEDVAFSSQPKFFNLYDQSKATFGSYRNTSSGAVVASGAAAFTHDMPLMPGQQVVVGVGNSFAAANTGIAWLDGDHNIIAREPQPIVPGTAYTPPTKARFWFVNFTAATKVSPYFGVGSALPAAYLNAGETIASASKIWAGKAWAMMGDSIVAQHRWAPTTHAFIKTESYTNWGVAGTRMADILTNRSAADFTDKDLAGISSGTNDFGPNSAATQTALGADTDAVGAATFWGAMRNNIETILGWKPTLRLFMMAPLHRGGEYTDHPAGTPLKAYRDAILDCARYYGVPVYDQYARSGIGPASFSAYLRNDDGFNYLHQTVDGGVLIGRQMGPWLEGL